VQDLSAAHGSVDTKRAFRMIAGRDGAVS